MNIENVVDVQISVSQVVASATRFGHMLIVCPYPKTPGSATVPAVTAYSVASITEEIKTAGFGESDPVYNAVQMLLKAKRLSDIVYIAVRQNTTDSVEDIALTMQRAFDYTSDFWAICPVGLTAPDVQKISEIVETQKTNGSGFSLIAGTTSVSDLPITGQPTRSHAMHQTQESDCANIGLAAACLPYAPGEETWQFKSIPGLAEQRLTSSEISAMEENNTGYYAALFGNECSMGGRMCDGEYIDTVRFKDWLVENIARKIVALFVANAKVPYTDDGISQVQAQIIKALEEGREAGGIADDEIQSDGSTLRGYTVTVPKASDLTSEQRQKRVLEGVTFTARLSGAIHKTVIRGSLTA